jgi:hypothetical protein
MIAAVNKPFSSAEVICLVLGLVIYIAQTIRDGYSDGPSAQTVQAWLSLLNQRYLTKLSLS